MDKLKIIYRKVLIYFEFSSKLEIFLVFGILEIGVGWLQMLMSVFPFYTKYLAWPGNSRLCVTNSL